MPVTRLIGCEPLGFGSEEDPMLELSAPVRDAVDRAIPLVEQVLRTLSAGAS
jgi:hypothetical protein